MRIEHLIRVIVSRRGQVHWEDPEDQTRSACGNQLQGAERRWGTPGEVNCQNCLKKLRPA